MINYEITVTTGDVFAAGTNANVFVQIYGDQGKTEVITLKSRSNNFERGTTEIFKVMIDLWHNIMTTESWWDIALIVFSSPVVQMLKK